MIRRAAIALTVILPLAAGCGPRDPLDRQISAESAIDYQIWLNRHLGALPPMQAERFRKAQKELQLFTVTEWQGQGADEQAARQRDQLHGLTVRDFIVQGHQLANVRLDRLLADQRRLLVQHDALLHRPATPVDGYQRLKATMDEIGRQISALEDEIAANEAVIRELRPGAVSKRLPPLKAPL